MRPFWVKKVWFLSGIMGNVYTLKQALAIFLRQYRVKMLILPTII